MNNERLKEIKDNIDYGMTGAKLQALKHAEIVYNEEKELYNEVIKLKSRIEKAAEYLKSQEDNLFMSFSDDFLDHDELITKKIGMTLLNILNGRSDE